MMHGSLICVSKFKSVRNTPAVVHYREHCFSTVWLLHGSCHMKLLLSQCVLCMPYTMSLSGHFIQSHRCRVHACLAETCHQHFWQNDWDLLCATVVLWWWNRYWNKSEHKKLTTEKKICPLLLLVLKSATSTLTTEPSPLPHKAVAAQTTIVNIFPSLVFVFCLSPKMTNTAQPMPTQIKG